jgi:nitrogen fixation protein
MKKLIVLLLLTILPILCFLSCEKEDDPVEFDCDNIIETGLVYGKWDKACSPYLIKGDIWIEDGTTLEIEAGVEVIFQDHYRFDVKGQLLAKGNKEDMIIITAIDSIKAWNGMRFIDVDPRNKPSVLQFCKISYAHPKGPEDIDLSGGGIAIINSDNIMVENCEIFGNRTVGPSEDIYANRTGGGGIGVSNCSPKIQGNLIHHNKSVRGHGGGLILYHSKSDLTNNIIFANEAYGGGGIAYSNLYNVEIAEIPVLMNNTIFGNSANHGGGLDLIDIDTWIINCIVYGNETDNEGTQIHLARPSQQFATRFHFNNIQGGFEAFGHNHHDTAPPNIGAYENNLDTDPEFIDNKDNFCLADNSPCIGAGIKSINIAGITCQSPSYDQQGNIRPSVAGEEPDIGALEHLNCR